MNYRIFNDTLNPEIWTDRFSIDQEIRNRLLSIATEFYTGTKLPAKIQDILLLGSAANYNWTPTSDIDLHILIDFREINSDPIITKQLVDSLKGKWNREHEISIKNHPIELYIQDVNEVNSATGIFSLLNNKWIKVPAKQNLKINSDLIQSMYKELTEKIKKAIASEDITYIKSLTEYIYNLRQYGLDKGGEYSEENIVFKILRSRGYLDQLKSSVIQIYDKKLSIKENNI